MCDSFSCAFGQLVFRALVQPQEESRASLAGIAAGWDGLPG